MDTKKYIEQNTKQGVMLTRRLPPGNSLKSSLNYFGGFPTLLRHLEWPKFKDYERCMLHNCEHRGAVNLGYWNWLHSVFTMSLRAVFSP